MSDGLVGQFTPIEKFALVLKDLLNLSEQIYKSPLPNKIAKFTVDLSIARTNKSLSSKGGGEALFDYDVKYPNWYYLKILIKGTGVWTLKFISEDKSSISLTNDEVTKGDEVLLEFTDLEFTNTAQSGVTSPTIWLEKRYF